MMWDQLVTTKVAEVAAGTLVVSVTGWIVAATSTLDPGDTVGVVSISAALLAVAGAFMYIVRKMADGSLVHRDPAQETAKLTRALEQSNRIADRSLERERILMELLVTLGHMDGNNHD